MLHGSLLEQCKMAGCNGDSDVFCSFWFFCLYYYTPPIMARVMVALAFGSYRAFIFSRQQASCITILGLDNASGIFQLTNRHQIPITYYCITCIKYLGYQPHNYYILPAATFKEEFGRAYHFRGKERGRDGEGMGNGAI